MAEISNTPKKVRLLHVDIMSREGVLWGETLRVDEGDSYLEVPEGWVITQATKAGDHVVTVFREHVFFIATRTELVEVQPLYVPTEHKDKAPDPRKVGRKAVVVN